MSPRIRSVVAVTVVVAALVVATACDPWVPPTQLAVTTVVDGPDADPGDGICEVTVGASDCSLRAAIDEGNALGSADIAVPAGRYSIAFGVTVTGSLSIVESGPGNVIVDAWFTIAEGAQLVADGLGSYNVPGARFLVRGTFVGRHLSLAGLESSGQVVVATTGTAVIENSILVHVFGNTPTVQNQGTLILRSSSLRAWSDLGVNTPALANTGRVVVASSVLQSCTGTAPESHGSNTDDDGSCSLTAPGDRPSTPADITVRIAGEVVYDLNPGSPLIDAVPVGVNGCGVDLVDDQGHVARPQDGDGDGVPACDIGARERPATP